MSVIDEEIKGLPPLSNAIVDKAIDNMTRKLIAGFRNKNNSRPNAKKTDLSATTKDTLQAVSAKSVLEVANRGVAWKEMLQLSLSHGISSIATMKFDGVFTVSEGKAVGLTEMPNTPGVYVVFDRAGEAVYVGDSADLQKRWHAGHLNEFRQGEKSGQRYKLSDEFQDGCTVKYIKTNSKETAAAVEAHLIKEQSPKHNSREELLTEQGTRSNIEAKKMKDASGGFSTLAAGAMAEASVNVGWNVFEQLSVALIKALKDELLEIVRGVSRSIAFRLRRLFQRIWSVIQAIINQPLKILSGIFEFVVNAVSKTISQFYNLAKNIYDLGVAAWQLFDGAKTLSTDELVAKVTETLVLSGTLILWDALDPVLESQLTAIVGPVAPYLSAASCAIGYGVSSYYLQKLVPSLVKMLISMKTGAQDATREMRLACEQLIALEERNLQLLSDLQGYGDGSFELEIELREHTASLRVHKAVEPLNFKHIRKTKVLS